MEVWMTEATLRDLRSDSLVFTSWLILTTRALLLPFSNQWRALCFEKANNEGHSHSLTVRCERG